MGFVWNALVDHSQADRLCPGSMCLRLRRVLTRHASLPYSGTVYVGTCLGCSQIGEAEGKGRILLAGWSNGWKSYVSYLKGQQSPPKNPTQNQD